jgi:hypothetical protein
LAAEGVAGVGSSVLECPAKGTNDAVILSVAAGGGDTVSRSSSSGAEGVTSDAGSAGRRRGGRASGAGVPALGNASESGSEGVVVDASIAAVGIAALTIGGASDASGASYQVKVISGGAGETIADGGATAKTAADGAENALSIHKSRSRKAENAGSSASSDLTAGAILSAVSVIAGFNTVVLGSVDGVSSGAAGADSGLGDGANSAAETGSRTSIAGSCSLVK